MPGLQPEDHEIDGMEFSSHHLAVSWRQRQHQQPGTLTSSLSPASSQPRFDCSETAFQEGRWKGLSGLSRKIHEPFSGEGVTAMPPPYPTKRQKRPVHSRLRTVRRAESAPSPMKKDPVNQSLRLLKSGSQVRSMSRCGAQLMS